MVEPCLIFGDSKIILATSSILNNVAQEKELTMSIEHSIGAMNQLADALDRAGFSSDDVTKLKQYSKLGDILDVLHERSEIVSITSKILEFVKRVNIQLPRGEFVACEHFMEDNFDFGSNFKKWFLDKVETHDGKEVEINIHKLTKSSVDGPIITELRDKGVVETSLSVLIGLKPYMDKNQWYVFYIKDVNGELRVVSMFRRDDGWGVRAFSVGSPVGWGADGQVVSGNSRNLET